RLQVQVLCCHGYKADLLGRLAARRQGIPVLSVSRGWTGESWKVRLYEILDRISLRWMDRVICVSEAQARQVRRAGVPARQVVVIRNAIHTARFEAPDPVYQDRLQQFFATPPRYIVGAAGRLSPEKGFGVLVEAARQLVQVEDSAGFVLFGDGPLREALVRQIEAAGLTRRFLLAGFHDDLDGYLPFLDLLVLPSFTEGLPNVVLEAAAARVPVVATAVGGTPEVIEEGVSGFLVPPGDPASLARRIRDVLDSETRRREMGQHGRQRVVAQFSFAAQGLAYRRLFLELVSNGAECGGRVSLRKRVGRDQQQRL
ncbi:MAG: glycosyltransferase, partial [Gemmataceae bacterium]|nr:glycosyltransferase [Gemmataceae bacterium]